MCGCVERPSQFRSWRVPTKDALVEMVDKLDPSALPAGRQLQSKASMLAAPAAETAEIKPK
jgi:hypothetical protein